MYYEVDIDGVDDYFMLSSSVYNALYTLYTYQH